MRPFQTELLRPHPAEPAERAACSNETGRQRAPFHLDPSFITEGGNYICLMSSSANSLHFTSVAPSIRRAKS